MIRVLLPASPTIPKPWLVVEHNQTIAEHDRVEGEPPSSLTKFSHSGWHISFPSVSEPSFNLKKQNNKEDKCRLKEKMYILMVNSFN